MQTASHVGKFFLRILKLDKIQRNTAMKEMEIIAFVTGNILLLFFYYNMVGLHLSAEARWFLCGALEEVYRTLSNTRDRKQNLSLTL